jgi:hypothetical protein
MRPNFTTLSPRRAFTMSSHAWHLIILQALYTLPYFHQTNLQALRYNRRTTRRNSTHRNPKELCNETKMPLFLHKMETRRLHDSDMKDLVRILRDVPSPTEESYERKLDKYQQYTKRDIQRLSHRLRSSRLSFGSKTNLCSIHKGLNQNLITDIWAWLRYELEGAIGRFLYPLIMSGVLTAEQEPKVRQLEPILQMWQSDFSLDASAPPGHEPIRCGSKWQHQIHQCPACMMARIGSDEKVLFALFAGMVGRFHTKTLDSERSTAFWDKTKSKRLRFVRYWIKKTAGGDTTLFEAGELGMHMKRLRHDWKQAQRRLKYSLGGTTAQGTPMTTNFRTPATADFPQNARPQTADQPSHQGRRSQPTPQPHPVYELPATDPKLGPEPRPNNAKRLSPAEQLGFEMPGMRERISADQQDIHPALRTPSCPGPIPERHPSNKSKDSNSSDDTVKPDDSVSVVGLRPAPLRIHHPPPTSVRRAPSHTQKRGDSRRPPPLSLAPSAASSYTITSYANPANSGPSTQSRYDPLDNPIWNGLESQEDRVERYRKLLGNPFLEPGVGSERASTVLPVPKRQSMYGAFSDAGFNEMEFDRVDEEVPADEVEEWEKDDAKDRGKEKGRQGSEETGDWEDLY